MKKYSTPKTIFLHLSILCFYLLTTQIGVAQETVKQYKGVIIDKLTNKPLVFASISTNKTNVSTVSNKQGGFSIKIPKKDISDLLVVSFLGYQTKTINVSNLQPDGNKIELSPDVINLDQVVLETRDAEGLIKEVLKRKGDNYGDENNTLMNAFYRESIKKRKRYVSLSEAIIQVNKTPYTSSRREQIQLFKARKSTDYKRLDTLALKLQGGPFNTLSVDLIKYPSFSLLSEDMFEFYDFSFQGKTKKDGNLMYIVNFKQKKDVKEPLYYGSLYVDAKSLALSSALFKLNIEDKKAATRNFIVKKPAGVKTTPIDTEYRIDYRIKDNKWYFSYSRINLSFKINWKKKIFNSVYHATMEMAATGFEENPTKFKKRMKRSIIMGDAVSGFSDPNFWGAYNIIEPEEPIEDAISKIKKQLQKLKNQS